MRVLCRTCHQPIPVKVIRTPMPGEAIKVQEPPIVRPSRPVPAPTKVEIVPKVAASPELEGADEPIIPRLSDHAILRYLERTQGIDINAIRRELMNENVRKAILAGATGITVNGYRMKVSRDGVIMTVLDRECSKPYRKYRIKRAREKDEIAEYFREMAEEMVG